MKTIFKPRLIASATVSVVTMASLVSIPATALTTTDKTDETNQTNQTDEPAKTQPPAACKALPKMKTTYGPKVAERIDEMKADFTKRRSDVTTRRDESDQKIANNRADRNAAFASRIDQLKNAEGRTDDQKAAIEAYSKDVLAAEKDRATKVDAAKATYRAALDEQISTHKQALTGAAGEFEDAVTTAFEAASADCTENSLQTLKQAIASARQAYTKARSDAAPEVKAKIKELATTKRDGIAAANADFKSIIAGYAEALKTALES